MSNDKTITCDHGHNIETCMICSIDFNNNVADSFDKVDSQRFKITASTPNTCSVEIKVQPLYGAGEYTVDSRELTTTNINGKDYSYTKGDWDRAQRFFNPTKDQSNEQ